MVTLSAGGFLAFAELGARGKRGMVARGLRGRWPQYRVPPDYWVRMRWALQRMIRSSNYSRSLLAQVLANVPEDRRREVRQLLDGFVENWPRTGAKWSHHSRLEWQIGDLTVRCQPHSTVTLDGRKVLLRFAYRSTGLLGPKEQAQLELLRLASAGDLSIGVLNVGLGSLRFVRVNDERRAFLIAEADEFLRLWRAGGGR